MQVLATPCPRSLTILPKDWRCALPADVISDKIEKLEKAARDGDDRIRDHLQYVRWNWMVEGSWRPATWSVFGQQSAPTTMRKVGITDSTPKPATAAGTCMTKRSWWCWQFACCPSVPLPECSERRMLSCLATSSSSRMNTAQALVPLPACSVPARGCVAVSDERRTYCLLNVYCDALLLLSMRINYVGLDLHRYFHSVL